MNSKNKIQEQTINALLDEGFLKLKESLEKELEEIRKEIRELRVVIFPPKERNEKVNDGR